MTIEKRRQIENEIARLDREVEQKKNELKRLDRECSHQWTEVKYDPIHHEGYMYEGDPPGTMGVDRRPSMYIPPSVTDRWQRTCMKCGKVEFTQHYETQTQVKKNPSFPKY